MPSEDIIWQEINHLQKEEYNRFTKFANYFRKKEDKKSEKSNK